MPADDRCPQLRSPAAGDRARRALPPVPAAARPRRRPLERPRGLPHNLPDGAGPTASVLDALTATAGPLPRVVLHDTEAADRAEPLEKPNSPEMPDPADRPARLQLFGEIARGGMGAVLRGRDPDLGRDLAVKVLLDGHRDKPELVRRFVEEAQIGGQLQHPGVVPVYELGTFADRRPFFAMKLVKGRTLAALLASAPAPADDLPRFLAHLRAGGPDGGLRPRPRRDPPRPEAVERDGRRLRRGPGDGLGPGQGPAARRAWPTTRRPASAAGQETVIATAPERLGRCDLSQAGIGDGHAGVHGPRAGPRRDRRGSTSGPTSSPWARSSARSSPAQPAFLGRAIGEIQRKAARGDLADALARLDACGADAELVALARDCLAAEPEDRPRDAGAVAERVTAYLAGVQERGSEPPSVERERSRAGRGAGAVERAAAAAVPARAGGVAAGADDRRAG